MNKNLEKQMKMLCKKNCHNDSFLTRKTYTTRMNQFLEFCSDRNIQKIQNIKNNAVRDYINLQIDNGMSERTLKTTLSAIRYYTKMCCGFSNSEYKIDLSNKELGIASKRTFEYREGISQDELCEALSASEDDFEIYAGIKLGYILGLRSNEIFNLRMYELRDALKSKEFKISIEHGTKGGKKRTVIFEAQYLEQLQEIFDFAKSKGKRITDKVLCGNETGDCKRQLSRWHNWWTRNAAGISKRAGTLRDTQLSAHCLRREYSRNIFRTFINDGMTKDDASMKVSECLGHGKSRKDITAIYLGEML